MFFAGKRKGNGMQPKNKTRWVIRHTASKNYFTTEGLGGAPKEVEIHRIKGAWRSSPGKARLYTDNDRPLPKGYEFEEILKKRPFK